MLGFFFRMFGVNRTFRMHFVTTGSAVGFIELFGALRTIEFMPLARNGNQGNSHKQDGKYFHRAAS